MQLAVLLYLSILASAFGKYLEGELHTPENFAFLARFCFLSEEGQFEYYFEYEDDQGEPNLLLYYDAVDQWPAVYKTNKPCREKEAVLHIEQNQIVNLTARYPYYKEFSGCVVTPNLHTTSVPKYTINLPTVKNDFWEKYPKEKHPLKSTLPISKTTTASTITTTTEKATTQFIKSTNDKFVTNPNTQFVQSTPFITSLKPDSFTQENFDYTTSIDENLLVENLQDTLYSTTPSFSVSTAKTIRKRAVLIKPTTLPKNTKPRRIVCRNARRFRSARERWWFLAISNCNATNGIHLKYKILMTNGPPGDYWHEHFSADEFYILPILMAFCIAYCFLLLAIVICSIELKSRQLLHSTYKLFVFSVMLQFFGIMLQSMAYLNYAVNGIGSPRARMVGSVFMGASETTFVLLLLVLAKGYTITRGRLPLSASIKLTIFMCLYVVTYLSLFIYEAKVFDPGEVLYLYESPAGYGLIILRVAAWCMFIYSTVFTLKRYPEKSSFYYPFNICGTLWYIAGPAFILSANTYIDKWIRESVVAAVLLFITFGGHLMFLILTMPSVANKNFPYHVRTTQIGVMELTGSNAIEQFSHHPYEPSRVADQAVIIPLTRRTEEIFGGLYTQRLNIHRNSNQDTEQPLDRMHDVTMQNVLSWSIAKNFTPADLGVFHQVDRSYLGSATSHTNSEGSASTPRETNIQNTVATTESALSGQSKTPNGFSTQEWVKEVPVELFTISKMVTISNTKNQEEHVT